eukprot:356037-Ditylum_brightwellii.AAC.1
MTKRTQQSACLITDQEESNNGEIDKELEHEKQEIETILAAAANAAAISPTAAADAVSTFSPTTNAAAEDNNTSVKPKEVEEEMSISQHLNAKKEKLK